MRVSNTMTFAMRMCLPIRIIWIPSCWNSCVMTKHHAWKRHTSILEFRKQVQSWLKTSRWFAYECGAKSLIAAKVTTHQWLPLDYFAQHRLVNKPELGSSKLHRSCWRRNGICSGDTSCLNSINKRWVSNLLSPEPTHERQVFANEKSNVESDDDMNNSQCGCDEISSCPRKTLGVVLRQNHHWFCIRTTATTVMMHADSSSCEERAFIWLPPGNSIMTAVVMQWQPVSICWITAINITMHAPMSSRKDLSCFPGYWI